MKKCDYSGPVNDKNPIKYYVNEEKRTCTAVVENVLWDMRRTLDAFTLKNNVKYFSYYEVKKFIENIPDKIVATARCSEEDEFNPETGCTLARARVLKKLYRYRASMMDNMAKYLDDLFNACTPKIIFFDARADEYEDEEKAAMENIAK